MKEESYVQVGEIIMKNFVQSVAGYMNKIFPIHMHCLIFWGKDKKSKKSYDEPHFEISATHSQ
jgi:hypothetical protein